MNISFPIIYPHLADPRWFYNDYAYDDAEITKMEQAHQQSLNSIGKKYSANFPIEKEEANPEPMQVELESDDEGADGGTIASSNTESEQVIEAAEYNPVGGGWTGPPSSSLGSSESTLRLDSEVTDDSHDEIEDEEIPGPRWCHGLFRSLEDQNDSVDNNESDQTDNNESDQGDNNESDQGSDDRN